MPKKTPTKEKVKLVTPQMVVASHEAVVKESLKKHNLAQHLTVRFPNKSKPPLIGRLGAWLVNKAGGEITIAYRFSDTITSKASSKKE